MYLYWDLGYHDIMIYNIYDLCSYKNTDIKLSCQIWKIGDSLS